MTLTPRIVNHITDHLRPIKIRSTPLSVLFPDHTYNFADLFLPPKRTQHHSRLTFKEERWQIPAIALTASNNRPMLLVTGEFVLLQAFALNSLIPPAITKHGKSKYWSHSPDDNSKRIKRGLCGSRVRVPPGKRKVRKWPVFDILTCKAKFPPRSSHHRPSPFHPASPKTSSLIRVQPYKNNMTVMMLHSKNFLSSARKTRWKYSDANHKHSLIPAGIKFFKFFTAQWKVCKDSAVADPRYAGSRKLLFNFKSDGILILCQRQEPKFVHPTCIGIGAYPRARRKTQIFLDHANNWIIHRSDDRAIMNQEKSAIFPKRRTASCSSIQIGSSEGYRSLFSPKENQKIPSANDVRVYGSILLNRIARRHVLKIFSKNFWQRTIAAADKSKFSSRAETEQ